jgi:hypothetical protein
MVIVPEFYPADVCQLRQWPEFAHALKDFRLVSSGKYFKVFSKQDDAGRYSDGSAVTR